MIYVILGQTASGKTALATEVCKKCHLPMINADAYQCYKFMDIGTSKPTAEELEGLEYYFINDREPNEPIDVKAYQEKGRQIIEKLMAEGKDIVISGGTSFYIKALLFPYEFPEIDEKISEEYKDKSLEELLSVLEVEDKATYDIIDKNNYPRVYNAVLLCKSNYSRANLISKNDGKPIYPCEFFAIDIGRDEVNKKINLRVDKMMEEGLINEVLTLFRQYGAKDNYAFKAIGYQEFVPYLQEDGNISKDSIPQLTEDIKLHTRQYAKRQRTFIRTQFKNVNVYQGVAQDIFDTICNEIDSKRRSRALLGDKVCHAFENKTVAVLGLGGVGSLIPSYLVRFGVRNLILVDFDKVDITNLNRQMMYDLSDLNKLKAEVQSEKLKKISPLVNTISYCHKITENNDFLCGHRVDFIFDCIDFIPGKANILKYATDNNIDVIVSGGLGFKLDSTKVQVTTMDKSDDRLIVAVKNYLVDNNISGINLDKIKVVTSKEARIKLGKKDVIGSVCTTPNAGGLAMISYFINKIKKDVEDEENIKWFRY